MGGRTCRRGMDRGGGWPWRIVGRLVGLRGGTARQSRPRGSVLGSAASRCVGSPSLPHSLTVF
jgi:hypothetical protein